MVVHKTSTAVVTHYTLLSHTISLAVGGSVALIAHTRPLHTIYIIGFSPNDFFVLTHADTWPAPALHQCGVFPCRAVAVKCVHLSTSCLSSS